MSLSKRTTKDEEYIITECGHNYDVFNGSSFNDYCFKQLKAHGKTVYQIDGVTATILTFEKLFDNAKRIASSLKTLGISPGDTITVSCENRLEYSAVCLAILFVGAVFAPINPTYRPVEIIHVIKIAKPKVIFCSAYTWNDICKVLRSIGVDHVIVFDDVPKSNLTNPVKLSSLLQAAPIAEPWPSRDEDIALILTSSGTTGLPKGVMLSYRNVKYICSFISNKDSMNLNKNTIVLGLLPLYHGYGCGVLLSSMLCEAKHILLPKFENNLFLSSIQKYKITTLCLVPPLMVFLAKHPLVVKYDLRSVREIYCGAAPLSVDLIPQVLARLPTACVRQGYGMTELSVVITVMPPLNNSLSGSVGKLAPGLQAKIVDVESGQVLCRGQQGELCVRGDCVMVGYLRDPGATQHTVDVDGWLHTGDVACVDQHGYFYIVDRIKDLIKYKGFQVPPAELESVLMDTPGVSDAAVIGLPDLHAGELPVAFVVCKPGANVSREYILNFVNRKVSSNKHLRDVRFVDLIPRNPTGKILRRVLKKSLTSKL